ncbi:unnamed protein product [Fraxinus pennsylvanica]|uniref:Thioesterase domain-containing protein n=1 Tax=Fraxinus pennsylvanica TaxID=56036 RepID=A0AAD2DVW9_9LAMI|nr:unnamed protein product [Fraxinus pennsylvanica]
MLRILSPTSLVEFLRLLQFNVDKSLASSPSNLLHCCGKDKSLFLGGLSISYLSAAPHNAEVIVDGSVVRSGRNLTVVAVEFRHKESGRLAFITRATFYNMPIASL